MPPILGFLQLMAVGFALAVAALIVWTVRTLTHPPRRTYASALARGRPGDPSELGNDWPASTQDIAAAPTASGPRPYTSWTFESRGLHLPVWDVPGDAPDGPLVIMTHGWSDSRIGGLARLGPLAARAARVILWDGPGHGDAPGVCTLGTREVDDLLALLSRLGGERPVVLMGWSMGAGISLAAARRLLDAPPIIAIIAESPYARAATPARNVLRQQNLPYRLNLAPALAWINWRIRRDRNNTSTSTPPHTHPSTTTPDGLNFDRITDAAALRDRGVRILVLHGSADAVSPPEDGRAIAAAAGGDYVEIPGGGHHGLWTDPASRSRCRAAVDAFLTQLPSLAPHTNLSPHSPLPTLPPHSTTSPTSPTSHPGA